MPRYMIELPFEAETCMKTIQRFGQREADFLPNVFWGCTVGGKAGWSIVEADNMDQAKQMVPESLQEKVSITEVKTLTPELIQAKINREIEKAA